MKRLIIIFGFLLFAIPAHASCTGSSPLWISTADSASLQTCVTNASTGDVVTVSGSATWTTTGGAISYCKDVTLNGQGLTTIVVDIASGFDNDAILMSGCAGNMGRITGFTFQNESVDSFGIIMVTGGTGVSLRIDHNTFEPYPTNPFYGRFLSFRVPVMSPGVVIDHNTVIDQGSLVENEQSADGSTAPTDAPGAVSWTEAIPEGANVVFFENNTMTYPHYATNPVDIDCDNGGRYVFRYNTESGNTVGNHGFDSVPNSCVLEDVYDNTLGGSTQPYTVQFRGGTGFVYSNLYTGSPTSGLQLAVTNYRSNSNGFIDSTSGSNHGYCDGTQSIDGNASVGTTIGWPCYEEIGRGSGASGGLTSLPLYEWDNCKVALGCTGTGNQVTTQTYNPGSATNWIPVEINANRDYYDSVSGFTGTVGVGIGLLAARPSTCTVGVSYWATDQQVLYQCSATNVWSIFYQAFIYPHILDVNPPAAPTWTYNAPTGVGPIQYPAVIPCPQTSGTCQGFVVSALTVSSGVDGAGTWLNTYGSCPITGFSAGVTTAQINGIATALLGENTNHTLQTCTSTGFTYTDGAGTNGTVAPANGLLIVGAAALGAGWSEPCDIAGAGCTITRVTDYSTPFTFGTRYYEVSTTGGSEGNQFSLDDTRFVIQEAGNNTAVYSLNPATGVPTFLYQDFAPGSTREPTFSFVTPQVAYNGGVDSTCGTGSDLIIWLEDFSSLTTDPTCSNGHRTVVADINAMGGSSIVTGLTSPDDEPGVSLTDQEIVVMAGTSGGSNTQNYIVVYTTASSPYGQHVYIWNTLTGEWYRDTVDEGQMTINNTAFGINYQGDTSEFTIHQVRMSPSGTFVSIAIGTCQTGAGGANCGHTTPNSDFHDWYFSTGQSFVSNSQGNGQILNWGNHWNPGYAMVAYEKQVAPCPGLYKNFGMYSVNSTFPGIDGSQLSSSFPSVVTIDSSCGQDRHSSWADDRNDTQPWFGDSTNDGVSGAGPPQAWNMLYGWQNEYNAQQMPSGVTWRFTHNYIITNISSTSFAVWAGTSNVAQDGRFALITSDWGCLLGQITGGVSSPANCSPNGTYNGRSDVFLIKLPLLSLLSPSKRAIFAESRNKTGTSSSALP